MCHNRAYHRHWDQNPAANFRGHRGHHPMKKMWREKFKAAFHQPPVNVQELDDQYILFLFAPGFEKNDFQISTVDNTLIISVEKKSSGENAHWKRKEYSPSGFKRRFELNDKIDTKAIRAKYENGVLELILPKLEGAETIRQDIEIV